MLGAIHQIGEPCQSAFNAGFLTHLYLIRTDQVVYALAPAGSSVMQTVNALGIKPGAPITRIQLRPKTATLAESSSETVDGVAYTTSLSWQLKGTAADVTNWIHANSKHRYVVLTRDTLGNCYMIGEPDNGVRLSWSRQVSQQSYHQLGLTMANWYPVQFIPTIDLDELFPDMEFDYSFDLSFS